MKAVRIKGIRILPLLLALAVGLGLLAGCGEEAEARTTVRLSEVTHSVFYAPQYVALELGFFEEEGLDIELSTSEGADHVMTAVLSDAVDIGFSGPEAAIYIYNEGKEDYAKVFAQVTQRDGSLLVAREPDPDFRLDKLEGKHVLPGRKGGVPYMTFEYIVREAGLTPGENVNFDTSIQYAAMTGAFLGGTGDYVTMFEPTASSVEAEGRGYVVASIGELAGEIPYTAYYAKSSYLEEHGDTVQKFVNALARGQQWVAEHSPQEIAKAIQPQFPDSDVALLASAIERYKSIDAYASTPVMTEEGLNRLMDVMESAGELTERVPFETLVDNSFAEKALS